MSDPQLLVAYPWPGNVRQLENTIYQAMIQTETDAVEVDSLKEAIGTPAGGAEAKNNAENSGYKIERIGFDPETIPETIIPMQEVEQRAIANALKATEGNIPLAAEKLAMSRSTLYRLVKKYGLK